MIRRPVGWLPVALSLLFGCYRTYSGSYVLSGEVTSSLAALDREIYAAIADLCFEEIQLEEAEVAPRYRTRLFRHRKEQLEAGCPDAHGSESTVLVTIGWEPPTITIRDIENNEETEFVRLVKTRIEERLSRRFGFRHLRFERQADLIF